MRWAGFLMKFILFIIILGFIFDALSFLYGIAGIIKKKNVSGFPFIGLICYIVAVVGIYIVQLTQDVKLTGEPIDILLTTKPHYIAIYLLALHMLAQAPLFIANKPQSKNNN